MHLLLGLFLVVATWAEWSQEFADSYHSNSVNVKGDPPVAPQTINFQAADACTNDISPNLVLTSSGRMVAYSTCRWIKRRYSYLAFFSTDFKGKDWQKTIDIREYATGFGIAMAADGKYALTTGRIARQTSAFKFDPQDGELLTVPSVGAPYQNIQCPNSATLFLSQINKEFYYVDNLKMLSTGYKYNINYTAYSYTGLASDPSRPRVAGVVSWKIGDPNHQRTVGRLIVSNVQVQGSKVTMTDDWSLDFPDLSVRDWSFATPTFSKDGRVFLLATPFGYVVSLMIMDGKNPPQKMDLPTTAPFLYSNGLSITSDGKYAFLKGSQSELIVVSTNPQQYVTKHAAAIAIDEENGLVYGVLDCQVFAFCLNNFFSTAWTKEVCTRPHHAQALTLGKYAGGQRRLFIGFGNVTAVSPILMIEPPSTKC